MDRVLFPKESYAIIGACMAVYNEMGHCFDEHIAHECLEIEFAHLGIPFLSKPPSKLRYRGQELVHTFEPDFYCFEKIILEIKAVETLVDRHRSQAINYLHATNSDLGLLVNFGSYPKLQHERLVHSKHLRSKSSDEPFEL